MVREVCVVEDLGTGYCHSHGLGWLGDSVEPADILGELRVEPSNGSSIFTNTNTTTTNNSTTNTIAIYWPLLVLRPACVDTLIITTQGKFFFRKLEKINNL